MRARSAAATVLLISLATLSAADTGADLTLKDAAGHKVHLRDLRGKPVVLNFWATWCGPCKAEMPLLVELEKQYGPRGVSFIAASLDDAKTKSKIPAFAAEHNIGFPIWYGASADDLDHLKLGGAVPATVFLDAEGRIVSRILGQARQEELRERVAWITREHSGEPSGTRPEPLVKHLP